MAWCRQPLIVFTNNDDACCTALALQGAGAHVLLVDLRRDVKGELIKAARASDIEVLTGHAVTTANGTQRIAVCDAVNEGATALLEDPFYMDCDLLAMSGGMSRGASAFAGTRQAGMGRKSGLFPAEIGA